MGQIALFYKDFGDSKSLVNLGTIVSGLDAVAASPKFNATIERVND